jgi:thioesterase domain-containing protein/acyl carrier protein
MSSFNRKSIYAPQSASTDISETAIAASSELPGTAASTDFWASIQTVLGFQRDLPPLARRPAGATPLLSDAEKRLWLLNEFQSNRAALTLPFTLRLRGNLDRQALERSLGEIARRHEILRTRYCTHEGEARCTVDSMQTDQLAKLAAIDLSALPPSEREVAAMEQAIAAAQTPFDLSNEALFRTSLLRLGETEHWLLIAFHHIVFDGWSEGIFFRELAALYRSFAAGEPSPLSELHLQYRDYGIWQRQCLAGDYRETLLTYWRQQLIASAATQTLPSDHARSAAATGRSQSETVRIGPALTAKLKTFSRSEKVTLFASLLAGFKLLLYRYTGQESLYVCTPSANRTHRETKELIGYFANLLILQTDLSGDPSFRTLLHRVRQTVSGAFAYQDLPVQVLMEDPTAQKIQLSQVMFVLQNMPRQMPELGTLETELLEVDNGATDFDLSLAMTEEDGGLCGKLKYSADLFEADTIRQMIAHYTELLSNVLEHPDDPLSSPQLLAVIAKPRPKPRPEPNTAIAALDNGDRRRSADAAEPRTDAERQLVEIWRSVLGIEQIGVRDNFFEMGGHSILALRLFRQIRQTFGKDLPLSTLFQAPTIAELAEAVQGDASQSTVWASLVPIRSQGTRPPIFCIHGIGGNIVDLYGLAHHLNDDQPFYGLQAVGLDGKQAPLQRIEEMAAHYLREIQAAYPEGPYCLAGNSMGGVVAFEMAQQLARQGQSIGLLAFLDTYGPKYYRPISWQKVLNCHWQNLLFLKGSRKLGYLKMLLKLIGWRLKDGLAAIRPGAQATKGRPAVQGMALAEGQAGSAAIAEIQTAHTQALRDYRPEPYLGKATLFRVSEQPWWAMRDRTLDWGRWISEELEIQEVPGTHNNLLQTRHAHIIAHRLQAILSGH